MEAAATGLATAIQRADGVTPAERKLKRLCDRSFLSLWSYSGIYRNQGDTVHGGDGKEVCDLLVVFQDHIIIFSDKDCAFSDTGDIKIDWARLLLPHLNGDLYALEIDDRDLRDKPKRKVQSEAEAIANHVLARRGLVIQGNAIAGSKPFLWQFGRVHPIDRDESMPETGIGVNIKTRSIFSKNRLSLIEQTRAEYKELAQRRLTEAAPKFETYLDHRKVVVLEFYGDWRLLDEDDAREIVSEAILPALIDEVWITIPEWVSESDYKVAYERVR